MFNIAVVVPSCRPEQLEAFLKAWDDQFHKHGCAVIVVRDADEPTVGSSAAGAGHCTMPVTARDVLGDHADVIFDHSDVCRNLGFAYVARFLPDVEVIISLDDDVRPFGDTIGDHLKALGSRTSVSWMKVGDYETRGMPYKDRMAAEVVLSHGVWEGVPDLDAVTQLKYHDAKNGIPLLNPLRATVSKGCLFACSAMNVAFKRYLLPWIYQAPMGPRTGFPIDRFGDIFAGITAKRAIDGHDWAAVTGHSTVLHQRASDMFENLDKEALGMQLNETWWKGDESHPYFALYREKLARWQEWLKTLEQRT